jgi:hypothetical protein
MESQYSEKLSESHDIAKRQTDTSKLVVWSCSVVGLVCILLGFYLVIRGATGGFNIGVDLKGIKAYFASLAPGLLFLTGGVVIIWAGARRKFRYVIPSEGGSIKVESGG